MCAAFLLLDLHFSDVNVGAENEIEIEPDFDDGCYHYDGFDDGYHGSGHNALRLLYFSEGHADFDHVKCGSLVPCVVLHAFH